MSLHAELDPQAKERLRKIQRNNTISSVVVAVLLVVLTGLIFGLIALKTIVKETPTFVTIQAPSPEEPQIEQKKVMKVDRKPASPSKSMAKVIVALTTNQVAVPVPDVEISTPSLEFGDGDGFGSGWGDGEGTGGGGSFFGTSVKGNHIAYVIDFSASMGDDRFRLMQEEMKKTLRGLNASTKYQVIMFAGPAWVAGDEIDGPFGKSEHAPGAKIKTSFGGRDYEWEFKRGGDWTPVGTKREPEWLEADPSTVEKTVRHVRQQRKVWGTKWDTAVELALRLSPPPDVIFFMTDGTCNGHEKMARSIADEAKDLRIKVNTIALMEPDAKRSLSRIARESGGEFTMVEKDGKVRKMNKN